MLLLLLLLTLCGPSPSAGQVQKPSSQL